jgi:hypothetical protein
MEAIIRRLLIVAWILVGLGTTAVLLSNYAKLLGLFGLRFNPNHLEVTALFYFFVAATWALLWALQFVLMGIVNPRKLFANTGGSSVHD